MSLFLQLTKLVHANFIEKVILEFYYMAKRVIGACQKGDDCTYSHDFPMGKPDVK